MKQLLSDDEYRQLQAELVLRPELGVVIQGSGGLRKVRWAAKGHGKWGSGDLLLGRRSRPAADAAYLS